jgi:hypothetical protein
MPRRPVKDNKYYSYLKYSGLAFQLAVLIGLAMFAGRHIESWLQLEKPVIQIMLILVFFSAFMYRLYLETSKDK